MNILINLKYTLAVTAGVCSSFAYAQKHPHIILIMTDQQRADAIGCMGNDAVISPNLDALAAEGTLFMNGYSSCPSSTPARIGSKREPRKTGAFAFLSTKTKSND